MKKIYLSPSNQTGNKFIIGNTNEGTVWLDIAKRTAKILEDYDCEVKVSKASQTLAARAAEAEAWGADCYISMHSNAAGTANKGARGVEVYYSPKKGPETRLLASSVLKELSHLFKNRGLKQSTKLIDCYKPAMPSIIGECGFHDNVEDATLILENKDKIAQLYVNALANALGFMRKDAPPLPKPTTPTTTPTDQTTLTAGTELELKNEPLYLASVSTVRASTVTGKYYFWGGAVINNRIRITNAKSRVGIVGQVTGWIACPAVVLIYKVKAGDTLGKIATAHYTTLKAILAANPQITNPDLIHVGDLIKIPVK